MKAIIEKKKDAIIKSMPKKYSEYQKISQIYSKHGRDMFENGMLLNIKLEHTGDFTGRCFIDKEKLQSHKDENMYMYWHPQTYWRIELLEIGESFSYDLFENQLAKVIPTELQLNTHREKRIKQIMKKGRHHLKQTQKAYNDLKELEA